VKLDLRRFRTYEEARSGFTVDVPETFNLVEAIGDDVAPDRPALTSAGADGRAETITFGELREAVARVGSGLSQLGVRRGSRVGLALPSTLEGAIAVFATVRIGAVAVLLQAGRPNDTSKHQLAVAPPDALFCTTDAADAFGALLRNDCRIVTADRGEWTAWRSGDTGGSASATIGQLLSVGAPDGDAEPTRRADPAFITFTSGTTGAAKGVVIPQSSVLAGIPIFQMLTELGPHDGDVYFNSLGWVAAGGLRTIGFPSLYFGGHVVAADHPLDGSAVAQLLTEQRVTVALLMPQVLRELRQLDEQIRGFDWSALRGIGYSGEPISTELREWLEKELDVVVNPYFGASEIVLVASGCRSWFPFAAGNVGRCVPGRELEVIDEEAFTPVKPGETGMIALRRSDPGLCIGYLTGGETQPSFPASAVTESYFLTHDLGAIESDGTVRYLGRSGQLILTSEGVATPPMDVEDAILSVQGVREATALQLEESRGAVSACVSLSGTPDRQALARAVADAVSERFRRTIEIRRVVVLPELPKTSATGKINRNLAADAAREAPPEAVIELATA
jgi:acetyl-CoA synthetase